MLISVENFIYSFLLIKRAGFGTRQGDIFVGINNWLHVVPADKSTETLINTFSVYVFLFFSIILSM